MTPGSDCSRVPRQYFATVTQSLPILKHSLKGQHAILQAFFIGHSMHVQDKIEQPRPGEISRFDAVPLLELDVGLICLC